MPICPSCLTKYPEGVTACEHDGAALAPEEAFAYIDKDLSPGDQVGEYQVEGKLGEGGFGAVYRAVHPLIGKSAAVKVLGRQFSSNPQMVSRFIAEARAVNQIRHKNIIDIFSFGQLPDGRQYYVMELLEGTPLDRYIAKKKRLSVQEAMPILRGIARAVDAAHGKGILHRDLKPENVFLLFDEDGAVNAKLLDFGLVKLLSDAGASHKTKTGTPMGTPYYMSPEQCRGKDVDGRTDVYSFGALVFEVLTGRIPFDGESAMDILVKHMTVDPPSASSLVPELSAEIDSVVKRMMAKEPEHRPATLGESVDALGLAVGIIPNSSPNLNRGAIGASDPRELGMRATLADSSAGASGRMAPVAQTFVGAEADVVPPKASRGPILLAAGGGALLVIGAVAFFSMRGRAPETGGAGLVSSAAASAQVPLPTATSVATATPPELVELRVDTTPAGAKVQVDGKDAGTAPGPFKVKPGVTVKLVISARGYKPREVTMTPAGDVLVPVTLDKQAAVQKNPTISSDLEGFDKK